MHRRVAPTRTGWTLIGAAFGLFFGAWYLGSLELAVLASAAVALVITSFVWSATRSMEVRASRTVVPTSVSVGAEARAEVEVVNPTGRITPTYAVTDAFDDGRRAARFLLAPLPPGAAGRGAYRLPTARRGRFNLGPLAVTAHEPFGLSTSTVRALGVDDVLVRPRVHPLGPLPVPPSAADSGTGAAARDTWDTDEFFALRDYVVGDELRRVHWRTTARTDRLMVRDDETRRRPSTIAVLDVDAAHHTDDSFERAVEAAASVCARFARDKHEVELHCGDARIVGLNAALDHLALVTPTTGVSRLDARLRSLTGRRGTLVVITGESPPWLVEITRSTAARVGTAVLVHCGTHEAPLSDSAVLVVPATRGDLAAVWSRALTSWTVTGSSRGSPSRR